MTNYLEEQQLFQRLIDQTPTMDISKYQQNPMDFPPIKVGLPTDKQVRKDLPVATGVIDYFPLALLAVAEVSRAGNDQHNPGMPLHWDKSKSTDEADALLRHFMERGTLDTDGMRHSAKVAWRALALLQREIEAETKKAGG